MLKMFVICSYNSIKTGSEKGTLLKPRKGQRKLEKFPRWATLDYVRLVHRKNVWYKKMLFYPKNSLVKIEYNRCSNMVRNLSRKLKREYVEGKAVEYGDNSRHLWDALNTVLNKEKKQVGIKNLSVEGEMVEDRVRIANVLNEHFVTVGLTEAERNLKTPLLR